MENASINSDNNVGNSTTSSSNGELTRKQKFFLVLVGLIALLILAGMGYGVYRLALPTTETARWRDIFVIALTVEVFLLVSAAAVLVVQIARLVNLVQNEVQPVLESANETINTLKGTASFLSDNLVRPVVKVNEYVAAFKRMLGLINLGK